MTHAICTLATLTLLSTLATGLTVYLGRNRARIIDALQRRNR